MQTRHIMLRLTAFFCLIILLCASLPLTVMADDAPAEPSMEEAGALWFYHVEGEQTVRQKNAEQSIAAGSTVKIMSGLLFCEQLAGREHEVVYITREMLAASAGRRLYLQAGDTVSVEKLLYAAVCGSYNDAYDVLACYLAGTREDFILQMNQRATELGAAQTVFTDVSGVDDSSQTSAADIGKIALRAAQNPLYMQINSEERYKFTATDKMDARTIYNPNALITTSTVSGFYNAKCRGMSAGLTNRAGGCVVTMATNGRESYISVVMSTATEQDIPKNAYTVTNRMISWVYNAYTYMELITPKTEICTIPVTVSDLTSEIEVRTQESLSHYLPRGLEIGKDITYSVRLIYDSLEAPVTEGTFVGYVAVLYNGQTLGTVPLYTTGSAERSSFVSSLKRLQALTQARPFAAGLIFFVVALTVWISVEAWIRHKTRHRWDKYFSMKMNPPPTPQKTSKPKK